MVALLLPSLALLLSTAAAVAAADITLSDEKLSATFGSEGVDFACLTELKIPGRATVLDAERIAARSTPLWSATFIGRGIGQSSLDSNSLAQKSDSCKGGFKALPGGSSTSQSFKWVDCAVQLSDQTPATPPPPPPAPPPPGPIPFVTHPHSVCAGGCMSKRSSGPKGGNCDRLPGCGHDAGLPFCDAAAVQARCRAAKGCTCCTTNGYLYDGSTAVTGFQEYNLTAFTLGGAGPPIPPPGPPYTSLVNATMEVSLVGGLLQYTLSFEGDGSASLLEYTIALGGIQTTSSTAVLSSTSARQLLGLYEPAGSADAVYFAAHDPAHVVKQCAATATTGTMRCTTDALDASLPLLSYRPGWPIAVTVVPAGDWWDLTQVYRAWVLPNSAWTRVFGALDTRTDLPSWLENITLWMNNNWGGDPLRPNYGGDPEYVQGEMLKVNALLDLPSHGGHLALHWYEWDTLGYALGSNHTKCEPTVGPPCGFDTHYPDYFPARQGCSEAIKAMQKAGMRVIPYINGQLYDTRIPRWAKDHANISNQKFLVSGKSSMATNTSKPGLNPHLEHFDGITSAVMCPHTEYWHGVMVDTMVEIVNEVGFDGVYVDQVGNGEQRNCADPAHNHTIHGGSFWAEAFYRILADVRSKVPPSMFMTEGIVEEVSGTGFDIMLGLSWTELPIWHSIYGGYGYATGHATSGSGLASGLIDQLTDQFMTGGTMGWFTYQDQGDAFFDPANSERVAYIRRLSAGRIAAKDWMVHGRATRTLALADTTGSLKSGCFLRDKTGEAASVVCAVSFPSNTTSSATYHLTMAPARFGLVVPPGSKVALTDLETAAALGTYDGNVTYAGSLPSFGLALLKVAVAM